MTRQPVPLHQQLASAIKRAATAVTLHTQQITTLQSKVAAMTALQPGAWENITLQNGWSNVSGSIPAQARLLTSTTVQIVGNIQGGNTADTTVIGTLTKGFYNTVHAHTFTITPVTGAAAVQVAGSISGDTDSNALSNGGIQNTSGTVNGGSAGNTNHTHSAGTYGVINSFHVHSNTGGGQVPSTPVNYNGACIQLDTSGNLILFNVNSNVTQLSFHESGLPLFTA